ncbi:hypothetical protein AVEN_229345-1 [Araneus ventricosus]|uniref:Uncharacterized protein n=1 Tax=Araneus ventricosus TaxID=182803 RepID=A0A4Y2PJ43_ARAVE|nr:hypothetical protein AVEN_229345-1 [Araneus ventricosus]
MKSVVIAAFAHCTLKQYSSFDTEQIATSKRQCLPATKLSRKKTGYQKKKKDLGKADTANNPLLDCHASPARFTRYGEDTVRTNTVIVKVQ